ncbi:MAG: MFS transporter [Candidatus Kariarchaeaceae archaeon]
MSTRLLRNVDFVNILFLHLVNHFLMFTLPIIILYIRDDLDLNYTESGILWTVLIVIMTTVSVFIGFYSDAHRESRFKLIYSGIIVMLIGWFLLLIADNYVQLILIFAFIGLGASTFHPPAMATTTEMFEEDKGKALSMFQGTGMSGNALTPLIFAGIQSLTHSWQRTTAIYAVTIALATIILFTISAKNKAFGKSDWTNNDENIEYIMEKTNSNNQSQTSYAFLLTPLLLVPLLFMSIRSSFFRTTSLFTSLLYEDYLGLSKIEASVATAAVIGIASLFILVGGWISDRWNERNAIMISSIGALFAATGLVFIADYSDLASFTSFYFMLNATYYIGTPATSALLANRVDPSQRGKLFGALFSLGQVLSLATPTLFGYIKDNHGLNAAFTFILVLAIGAFFIGFYIYQEEKNRLTNNL